jgi:hypothetical protein
VALIYHLSCIGGINWQIEVKADLVAGGRGGGMRCKTLFEK